MQGLDSQRHNNKTAKSYNNCTTAAATKMHRRHSFNTNNMNNETAGNIITTKTASTTKNPDITVYKALKSALPSGFKVKKQGQTITVLLKRGVNKKSQKGKISSPALSYSCEHCCWGFSCCFRPQFETLLLVSGFKWAGREFQSFASTANKTHRPKDILVQWWSSKWVETNTNTK